MIKEKSLLWQKTSRHLGRYIARLPFHQDVYTWATLPAAALGLIAVINQDLILGFLLFTLAGVLDLCDGACARERKLSSGRGAFLDGTLDRIVDFLLIMSYFWLPLEMPLFPLPYWIAIANFVVPMPSFIVAYANHRQAVKDANETVVWRIMNRGEMYIFKLLIILFAKYIPTLAGSLFAILVVLCAITVVQSFILALIKSHDY